MNERQQKIQNLYKSAGEKEVIDYYGSLDAMLDVDDSIRQLSYISDKITLAQMALDFKLAKQLISNSIIDEQEKKKYFKLKEVNIDLDETINIELLSSRYAFLDDLLDSITTDIETQQRLISLSDERLEIFKQLYDKVKNEVSNPIPIFTKLLCKLGTSPYRRTYNDSHIYDILNTMLEENIKHGIPLSETDKEKLLFLYTSNTAWNVKSLEDLASFGERISADMTEIDGMIEKERLSLVKNIENIQNALLWKCYGISLDDAKSIVSKYKASSIEITDDNKETMNLYLSLYKIVTEKDAGKLIKIFDEFSKQKETTFSYMQPVLIESELRDMFSQELNKVTFKIRKQTPKSTEGIEIYDAGTDFKMIITSVGAYQGDLKVDNYNEYWNSPHIRSHGNCCSLIANNNLSTATIRNTCFGFEDFEAGMLLCAGNRDLNSTIHSRELDFSVRKGTFMLPNDLINATRGTYNELVYERRDLADKRPNYKKNPDYLVFFEEFKGENIETLTDEDILNETDEEKRKLLQEQKRIWEETKKASKDFSRINEEGKLAPLPIVKINREECAISESKKIQEACNAFLETKEPTLLPNIITQFENNRIGNRRPHDYIREKYFSQNSMQEVLTQIISVIKSIEDKELRLNNINMMGKLISMERENFKKCIRKEGQKASFSHKEYLNIFREMKQLELESQK